MSRKFKIAISVVVFLIIAFALDARDQLTYYHNPYYNNYFSLSNLNVENWTTFSVGIFAVFGTWYVTNSSANKQITNENELRKGQVEENKENLLLEKIAELRIYYFIKNVLEDNSKLNIELSKHVFLPVNTIDVNYIEWQREINILNEYLRFKESALRVGRPIKFYPFDDKQISKIVLLNDTDVMLLVNFKELSAIKLDINVLLKFIIDNQEKDKFDHITYDMKNKMTLVSRIYFNKKVDFLRLEYEDFIKEAQAQILKINDDYNEIKYKIKKLIELYNTGDSWEKFEELYSKVYIYMEKYNYLQMVYHENSDESRFMNSINGKNLSFSRVVAVDTSSDYLQVDTNLQLMVDIDQYREIVNEIEQLKSTCNSSTYLN